MASSVAYAELHFHLEGSLDAATLLAIDPTLNAAEIEARYAFNDFPGFLDAFKWAVLRLNGVDDFRLLARNAFRKLAADGVVYAEVIHSAGICLWRKQDARAILAALIEEGGRAPLEIRWIVDGVRQLGADHLMQVARLAGEFRGTSLCAFGVGGDEASTPAALLKPAFDLAREQGFHLVPHAGETSNAQNVWDALDIGAERIGHGIRAIEDPRLVAELARRRIPLEISLSSNVMTGAVKSIKDHPAKRLHDAGVSIVLNTDDPAFFRTTMAREFDLARDELGFTSAELEQLRRNAFEFAFARAKASAIE